MEAIIAATGIKSKKIAEVMESGCVACGSCMNICPREAITVPKGITAVIDEDKCIGCGLCRFPSNGNKNRAAAQ